MIKSEHINQLHLTEARWFAIYTSFKREKVVEKMLRQKGISVYLPLQKVARKYGRKVRSVELPLISCYLFVKITKDEYVPVLETDHVLKFIRFSKDLFAIPDSQIELLKRVTGEGIEVAVENRIYRKGDLVEVVSGSLTGVSGRLISIEGKNQLTIELTGLGCSLRMGIDPGLVKKIKSSSVS